MCPGGFSSKASAADSPAGTRSRTAGPQVASSPGRQDGFPASPTVEGGFKAQCPAGRVSSACLRVIHVRVTLGPGPLPRRWAPRPSAVPWRDVLGAGHGHGLWALPRAVRCRPWAGAASGEQLGSRVARGVMGRRYGGRCSPWTRASKGPGAPETCRVPGGGGGAAMSISQSSKKKSFLEDREPPALWVVWWSPESQPEITRKTGMVQLSTGDRSNVTVART